MHYKAKSNAEASAKANLKAKLNALKTHVKSMPIPRSHKLFSLKPTLNAWF